MIYKIFSNYFFYNISVISELDKSLSLSVSFSSPNLRSNTNLSSSSDSVS